MSLIPRLVVAYDFSDPARRAFELGVFMGRQLKADVHVVTVLDSRESDSDTAGNELDDLRQLLEMRTCGGHGRAFSKQEINAVLPLLHAANIVIE